MKSQYKNNSWKAEMILVQTFTKEAIVLKKILRNSGFHFNVTEMSLRNDRKCYRGPRWWPMMIVLKTVSSQSSALLSQITKKNKDLTFILVYVMIHFCLKISDHISFELKYRHGCCRNEGLWLTLVIIKQIICLKTLFLF